MRLKHLQGRAPIFSATAMLLVAVGASCSRIEAPSAPMTAETRACGFLKFAQEDWNLFRTAQDAESRNHAACTPVDVDTVALQSKMRALSNTRVCVNGKAQTLCHSDEVCLNWCKDDGMVVSRVTPER